MTTSDTAESGTQDLPDAGLLGDGRPALQIALNLPDPDAEPLVRAYQDWVRPLVSLRKDWDSYGAAPPTTAAVLGGLEVVLRLYQGLKQVERDTSLLRQGRAVPMASGGIQLEWRLDGFELEIAMGAHGTVEFLWESEGAEFEGGVSELGRLVERLAQFARAPAYA